MTTRTIHLDGKMVPASLRGAYSGKQFKAVVCTEVTIPSDAGLWSGGSRDTFQLIHLETGQAVQASDNMSAPWDRSRKDQQITLQPGFAVVEHSMFCGKDMGLTFYVHPDNAAKLLPAPVEDLSATEKLVLTYTKTRKSSYMGRDRYQMAIEDARYGYGENRSSLKPTRDEWETAKQALIARGLLNKAGAITVAGRNAVNVD